VTTPIDIRRTPAPDPAKALALADYRAREALAALRGLMGSLSVEQLRAYAACHREQGHPGLAAEYEALAHERDHGEG
jgi:hypothetical protein